MLRFLSVCVALVGACAASPQPVVCTNDGSHCMEEYYCDTDAHVCRPCLNCQDLKRDPPESLYSCIKSVTECGACYNGLVADLHGGVNAECVPPDGGTSYLWLFIIVGLVFIGLVVGIIVYVARNPEMFKTPAPSQPSFTARITASAPDPPPPYHPLPPQHQPHQPPQPGHYDNADNGYAHKYENEGSRFIIHPPPPRPADGRVPEASQTAKVYAEPVYSREHRSPSPDQSEPDETTDFTIHDEETTMSTWTPAGDDVLVTIAGGEAAAAAGAGACDPAPAKKRCVRQDSNNNRNRESSSGDSEAASPRPPSPGAAPPFSFTTQIFNVVQINTNK